jgi:hypothetical protein
MSPIGGWSWATGDAIQRIASGFAESTIAAMERRTIHVFQA